MVSVNSIFLTSNSGQGKVKSTGEKAAGGEDFYSFLSRSMNSPETANTSGKRNLSMSKLPGYQSGTANQKNAPESGKINGTGSEEGRTSVKAAKADQMQELTTSDEEKTNEKYEEFQNVINELMALFQTFGVIADNVELSGESAENIAISENVKHIISATVNRLLEIAGFSEGKISELAQNFAEQLNQMLTEDFTLPVPEGNIAVYTGQVKELLSKMMNEAENIRTELASENVTNGFIPENGQESGIADENSVQSDSGNQPEIRETSDDNRKELNSEDAIKNGNRENSAAADKAANVQGNQKTAEVNLWEDFSQIMQNTAVTAQTQQSDSVYPAPVRTIITDKADILHQVAEKAKVLVDSDKSEIVIQLKPESLGKIQLQVIHERGEIAAKFMAENEQVKAILESNMQLLRDSLEKNGIDIQNLSVSVGQHNHSNDGGNNRDRNTQNHLNRMYYEDLSDAVNAVNTYGYTETAGSLYGFEESEINLIA